MRSTVQFLAPLVVSVFLAQAAAAQWDLVWSDEFDGPNIDPTKWAHEVNGHGGGNAELQYYTARGTNSFIENGHLVIQALDETYAGPDGTRDYTSARLRTLNQGDWQYGRFEARMKLPYGQGLWPAFWMLPTDWVYGGWAASGEIDIMELVGHEPDRVHGTLHYGGEWPANAQSGSSYTLPSGTFADDFHVFAVEWEDGEFRWYVDGHHVQTQTSWYSDAAAYPAPFNQRFHLLLNVAVGGNWPGSPDGTTVFPQRMEVDYVRVYSYDPPWASPQDIVATGTSRIEAEDYMEGGQGVGYSDSDAGNTGGAYRSDDVDIEDSQDTDNGYSAGWTASGEWLRYRVDVESTGLYDVGFRVASSPGGGALHLKVAGTNATGTVSVPATGGWYEWSTLTLTNLVLTAGVQDIELYIQSAGFNLNWIEFIRTGPVPGSVPKLTVPGPQGAYVGHALVIGVSATEGDGDPINLAALPFTVNASFADHGNGTGQLTFVPDGTQLGQHLFTFFASDKDGLDSAQVEVTVQPVDHDADGDGMPDLWELSYFGNPTNAVANLDEDGEGATNGDEFVADTDPTNETSYLHIDQMALSNVVYLSFPASRDRVYDLQATTNPLVPSAWLGIQSNIVPTADHVTVVDPTIEPDRAYRVRVRLPGQP